MKVFPRSSARKVVAARHERLAIQREDVISSEDRRSVATEVPITVLWAEIALWASLAEAGGFYTTAVVATTVVEGSQLTTRGYSSHFSRTHHEKCNLQS